MHESYLSKPQVDNCLVRRDQEKFVRHIHDLPRKE